MTYELINPPLPLEFTALSKQALKQYYNWFLDVMPLRIKLLEEAVRAEAHPGWVADLSPESLVDLGDWFSNQVAIRPRTPEELKAIQAKLAFPMEVPAYDLDNKTVLIAIDVGMYFGTTLMKNNNTLRWDQKIGSKKFADYGQPVIVGFGAAILNPVRIATMLAYGIADRSKTGARLAEVYKVWASMVKA
ncbi:hypothetical protein [Rhizobium leguminosarum]|jgi:hypothetical protein|uniref:Uncharacterized protein n=1 Tax=Rhizobium leguminosarum TaxID=384 RepID=A0A4Q8XV20_RHILE|nr:hypothetical protein [Rhizobium leguminosarum]TAV82673.1 hypothetical protein ELI21_29290 [Rhizobium leguminosarum]TAV83510.1 hypothetical protein ELI22_29870 [Rhizobium leguminosarum]TAW14071.1 hypothetical protein ELI19_33385 [Rhizobium leguminosarum]TAW26282.1 hypothetical protein ELI23_29335 [Rhizobium leguminosarum]TAW27308.1 hypothetical protein ELI18_33545 [Rhizobium leguminosarum]